MEADNVLGLRVLAEHYREERQSYKTDLALGFRVISICSIINYHKSKVQRYRK